MWLLLGRIEEGELGGREQLECCAVVVVTFELVRDVFVSRVRLAGLILCRHVDRTVKREGLDY